MARVGAGIVIRLVAARTRIRGIGIIAVVAGIAIVRNRNMRSGKRINGAVVERRWRPGTFAVTTFTAGRKLIRRMVGVKGCGIIGLVAAHTGIGRIVVIPVVASCTIIGNRSMGAIQRVIITVDGKSGGCPAGGCRMARSTIVGQTQRSVIWVRALVEICNMAC